MRSCMSPRATPLVPASASAALAIISIRIQVRSRSPLNKGAVHSMDSAKNRSHAKMSSAYATEPLEREEQRYPREPSELDMTADGQDHEVDAAGDPGEQAHEDQGREAVCFQL